MSKLAQISDSRKDYNLMYESYIRNTVDMEYEYKMLAKDGTLSISNLPLAEAFRDYLKAAGKAYYADYVVGSTYYFTYNKRSDNKIRKHFTKMRKHYINDMAEIQKDIDTLTAILAEPLRKGESR